MRKIFKNMNAEWEVKKLDQIKMYLGMVFNTNEVGIDMNQILYAEELLKLGNMRGCKTTSTPMTTLLTPLKDDDSTKLRHMVASKFRSVVNELLWLSLYTRPEISYAVSKLGFKVSHPVENGNTILKIFLRYLKGTIERDCLSGIRIIPMSS